MELRASWTVDSGAGMGAGTAAEVVIAIGIVRRGSSLTSLSKLEEGRGGNMYGAVGLSSSGPGDGVEPSTILILGVSYTGIPLFEREFSVVGVRVPSIWRDSCGGKGEYCCCCEGKSENRLGGSGRFGDNRVSIGLMLPGFECVSSNAGSIDERIGARAIEVSRG